MILVAGGSGLVGRILCSYFESKQIPYVSTYVSRPTKNGKQVDFSHEAKVRELFQEYKPSVCINCIVQRLTDKCEEEWNETKQVNITIPATLASICKEFQVYFIHFSTDYVFDGAVGHLPYSPTDLVNPLQNYGISKLLSEYRVRNQYPSTLIIRTPVLYSDQTTHLDESAVTMIGKKVLCPSPSKEDDYSIRRPVFISDICPFIMDAITDRKNGIYHFYNPHDATTKWKIANQIASYLRMPSTHIQPVSSFSNMAARPYDTNLTDEQYDINQYSFIRLSEGIQRCFSHLYHPRLSSDTLVLLDLDGTLLDTEQLHFSSYVEAYRQFGYSFSTQQFETLVHTGSYPDYPISLKEVRELKNKLFRSSTAPISFCQGGEAFIAYLVTHQIPYCIVTNTSLENVEWLRSSLPVLQHVTNWITRNDYTNPKPHPEPYQLAKQKYGSDTTYTIGIENTLMGYESLRHTTSCIYMMMNPSDSYHKTITEKDVYQINTFDIVLR